MKNVPNSLRLEVLNGVLQNLPSSEDNRFLNLFGTDKCESDTVRWAAEYGSMGMTPFSAPGTPSPVTTDDDWYSEGSARAAVYKEKRYFDESFLNNLADPINPLVRQSAEKILAKQMGSKGQNDAAGLGQLLGQEQQAVRNQGGIAGDLLGKVLDQDGDGQLGVGDLIKLGSGLLGSGKR